MPISPSPAILALPAISAAKQQQDKAVNPGPSIPRVYKRKEVVLETVQHNQIPDGLPLTSYAVMFSIMIIAAMALLAGQRNDR